MGEHYKIARSYESYFADAFLKMLRELVGNNIARSFEARWNAGASLEFVLDTIPFFVAGEHEPVWDGFLGRLYEAYYRVINESGISAMNDLNDKAGTHIVFTMDNVGKASRKSVPIIPVNPYSMEWIKKQALKLIKEGFKTEQRKVVKKIITESFKKGLRGSVVVNTIQKNIGLTDREYKAVENRRAHLESQNVPPDRVELLADQYRESLLKKRASRIARTETITAEAAGRNQAWQIATDTMELPEMERVWISAPSSPRTCIECMDLDGTVADLGEQYAPGIFMPPAHPQCRCTEILRVKGETVGSVERAQRTAEADDVEIIGEG